MQKETHLVLSDIHHELDICQIARERESILDQFQEGDPCRPNVGPDAIIETRQSLGLNKGTGRKRSVYAYAVGYQSTNGSRANGEISKASVRKKLGLG